MFEALDHIRHNAKDGIWLNALRQAKHHDKNQIVELRHKYNENRMDRNDNVRPKKR